jgi:hypothetical protein
VFKHRSIEDAEALRERWEDANFRARREQIDRARGRWAVPCHFAATQTG